MNINLPLMLTDEVRKAIERAITNEFFDAEVPVDEVRVLGDNNDAGRLILVGKLRFKEIYLSSLNHLRVELEPESVCVDLAAGEVLLNGVPVEKLGIELRVVVVE